MSCSHVAVPGPPTSACVISCTSVMRRVSSSRVKKRGHRLATPRMGLPAVPPSWQAAPMALTAPLQ